MDDIARWRAAMELAVVMFEQGMRGTGRTTHIVEKAAPGDVIIVGANHERTRISRMLAGMGKHGVLTVCWNPAGSMEPLHGVVTEGRVWFNDDVLFEYWRLIAKRGAADLERIAAMMTRSRPTRQELSTYDPNA